MLADVRDNTSFLEIPTVSFLKNVEVKYTIYFDWLTKNSLNGDNEKTLAENDLNRIALSADCSVMSFMMNGFIDLHLETRFNQFLQLREVLTRQNKIKSIHYSLI